MHKTRYIVHGLFWVWSFVLLSMPRGVLAADLTVTIEGTSATTIYGQPRCLRDEKISFSWKFVPGGSGIFVQTQPAKYKIILGSNDANQGILLVEGNLPPVSATPTPNTPANQRSGEFTGSLSSGVEDAQAGMIEDGSLTIKDLIGYYRVNEQQKTPEIAKICDLEAPQKGGEQTTRLYFVAEYHIPDPVNPLASKKETAEGVLEVRFDLTPPPAPDPPTLSPSEKSITVSWIPEKNFTYDVFYSEQPFASDAAATKAQKSNPSALSASSYPIPNLSNSTEYYIAIRSYDEAGNPGAFSDVVSGKPIELTDFYEGYRQAGGKDTGFQGGFCFLATAAYGSYDHRYVRILRDFRDQILMPTPWGEAFVRGYYRHSPAFAQALHERPLLRSAVGLGLLPLVAIAALVVRLPWPFQLFLFGLLWLVWRRRFQVYAFLSNAHRSLSFFLFSLRRVRPSLHTFFFLFLLPLALTSVVWPSNASADSPRNFSLELRGGIYRPQIDSEPGLSSKPYTSFYGDGVQPYLEVSLEWLFFKRFGSLGLGASAGVTWASATAKGTATTTSPLVIQQTTTETTTTTQPSNQTAFYVLPLRLELIYRMDYFVHNGGFPLVPYVRGGLDYNLWWVLQPDGALALGKNDKGETVNAIGGRFGFHFGVGFQFLLDIIDRSTARTFDLEYGVNHTYLFVEWNFSWIGVVSPGLNLSDSSFRAGLMFQF